MPKVTVYVPAADAKSLEAEGQDPAEWVREAIRKLLSRRRQEKAT